MIRMYSKRLMMPFVGVIQVAEIGRTRALSADGDNWAIQYAQPEDSSKRTSNRGDSFGNEYSVAATIAGGRLQKKSRHNFLDPGIQLAIERLFEAVSGANVPFAAADRYEYWLLDATDGAPLALLESTVDEKDTVLPPPHPTWLAMPAAQLKVQAPESGDDFYVPPVNYRLQTLIEERAGAKPRAAWFERSDPTADDFPPCLIREDWENEQQQQLCDLYIQRLAPRLLMTHGLSKAVRGQLEQFAREFVFDVERFYPLYPDIIDESLMNAARIEARLRRANKK